MVVGQILPQFFSALTSTLFLCSQNSEVKGTKDVHVKEAVIIKILLSNSRTNYWSC